MKSASNATLAIIASGKWLLADLYDLTLITGQSYHFTNFQVPLTAAVFPSSTKNTYTTGLIITRDTMTLKVGTEAGNLKLSVSPQGDSPNAPVLIGGYPILQAARYGFLDGATLRYSKLFLKHPALGAQLDTSQGAVGWFLGQIQEPTIDRLSLELSIDDALSYLGTQQMPRVLWGAGCFHEVYDAGCTLLKSAFTSTGTIASVGDNAHYTSNLTQADDFFDLGVLTFTGNVTPGLAGVSLNVASFKHASGSFAMRFPAPKLPAVGDTFTVYPGCDKQQPTCSGKFNNLIHFGGQPYIPVPETTLDGGTDVPAAQTPGSTAGQIIGSAGSGRAVVSPYRY